MPAVSPLESLASVLVAADQPSDRQELKVGLQAAGCIVLEAASAAEALELAAEEHFDLVLLGFALGPHGALALLPPFRALQPRAELAVVAPAAAREDAVDAMRSGASDWLERPLSAAALAQLVRRARERARAVVRDEQLRSGAPAEQLAAIVTGESPGMRRVIEAIARAAAHDVPVLLRGEHGTGKSCIARLLHDESRRRGGPFVAINCPTLSPELQTAELFGHVRGAFSGALRAQPGQVEAADGGTLMLDEIGEISSELQARLLRFVQERTFERVGEARVRRVDVRLVAASNHDLDSDVAAGRFREDLLYRLNTVEITVPPLRERREDIPALARAFAVHAAASAGRPPPRLSAELVTRLCAYHWPGNVRELENAMARAVIFSATDAIELEALPERIAGTRAGPWLGGDFTLAEIQEAHINRVAERMPTQEAAARVLGIDVSTLWRRRRRQR